MWYQHGKLWLHWQSFLPFQFCFLYYQETLRDHIFSVFTFRTGFWSLTVFKWNLGLQILMQVLELYMSGEQRNIRTSKCLKNLPDNAAMCVSFLLPTFLLCHSAHWLLTISVKMLVFWQRSAYPREVKRT